MREQLKVLHDFARYPHIKSINRNGMWSIWTFPNWERTREASSPYFFHLVMLCWLGWCTKYWKYRSKILCVKCLFRSLFGSCLIFDKVVVKLIAAEWKSGFLDRKIDFLHWSIIHCKILPKYVPLAVMGRRTTPLMFEKMAKFRIKIYSLHVLLTR